MDVLLSLLYFLVLVSCLGRLSTHGGLEQHHMSTSSSPRVMPNNDSKTPVHWVLLGQPESCVHPGTNQFDQEM